MRSPIVFATYSRRVPIAQIGVLKRVLRLIQRLRTRRPIHLVNFGHIPPQDPLVKALRGRVVFHEIGPARERNYRNVIRALKPRLIVQGESPVNGAMFVFYRSAASLRVPQICIENYYGPLMRDHTALKFRFIHEWILIGIAAAGTPPIPRAHIVPPCVHAPPVADNQRRGVCVLGYDDATLKASLRLLAGLPPDLPVQFFLPEDRVATVRGELGHHEHLSLRSDPGDAELYRAMGSAQVLLCKNGYQQMVEALYLGTPLVCVERDGGLPRDALADEMAPAVQFVSGPADLPVAATRIQGWLGGQTPRPLVSPEHRIADPVAYSADVLERCMERRHGQEVPCALPM